MTWRRRLTRDEFAEEIRLHLELETERLIDEGMSPEEARRTAHARFGSVTATEERFYESTRLLWLDPLRSGRPPERDVAPRFR